ncbi:MAG: monofunctional biosynthetic peptidoglycan transglycosylase [Balneolaceae bacterium]|nr:monofunctional biosynthetic peptidoglycan transglycosylase [Balneolaceae bacterium]
MNKENKPLLKRPGFYVATLTGAVVLVLLTLILSVVSLRWINPPATSFTLQEDWTEIEADRYNLRDYWVPADDIPIHMKWAVVASEDQLFWEHRGFDVESIREAWEQRQTGERSRGASTISQQVAKNLYLWPAHSFFRKGIEAGITVLIELFWPKERIIEVYLNIAEFGPGIYGIGKASEHFFDRSATELTPEHAARMAAVLPSPKRMRVNPPSPYAAERSRWILRQMTQLTGIAYIQIAPDSEPDKDDPDPLILDAEFLLDESLQDTIQTTRADTVVADSLLLEIDLPDSLLNLDF